MKNNTFWDKFYEKPLDQIPWQGVQSDWFKELVDNKKIIGSSGLDLGCGTGRKSIYLAKSGFDKVLGIDIAQKAINYAKQNAKEEQVEEKCTFTRDDVTNWSFVKKDLAFDFILDWANLHGILKAKRDKYLKGIDQHSHQGTLLLIRTFTIDTNKKYLRREMQGIKNRLYLFKEQDIKNLFPNFKIIKKNISFPENPPATGVYFLELLMKKV